MKLFIPLLTALFIALKLTGFIAWSWVWVLFPLWMGAILVLLAWTAALAIIVLIGGD